MNKLRVVWGLFLILVLTACEHKELHYVYPRFHALRVEFDWSRLIGYAKPEGMRVVFFPEEGMGEPWIFDFPNGEGRRIELPANDYGVICYNYDTDGIVWANQNRYSDFMADTRDVQAPDGVQSCLTPSWLCGDHIGRVLLKDIPVETEQVITLFPVNMVCRYTYEVNGIRKLERVANIRAGLSGMSGSLLMAEDKLPDALSERLLFGGTVVGEQVRGGFYTFGCCQDRTEPNVFRLYLKSKGGKTYLLEQDVSEQVHAVPVSGHIADVHIVINLDVEISDEHGSEDDAGFDVGADDWADVNESIIC